jgi:trk system potassium uptake protein
VRVVMVTRLGEGMLPHRDTVVQEGDLLHVAMAADRIDDVNAVFEAGPQRGED